jgi:hypothetical protein
LVVGAGGVADFGAVGVAAWLVGAAPVAGVAVAAPGDGTTFWLQTHTPMVPA